MPGTRFWLRSRVARSTSAFWFRIPKTAKKKALTPPPLPLCSDLPLSYLQVGLSCSQMFDLFGACVCDDCDSVGQIGVVVAADGWKINLRDASAFRLHPGPISRRCGCHTCSHHSLAYLHHLLATHEMLASLLLNMHVLPSSLMPTTYIFLSLYLFIFKFC